jgi:Holliday junction resolvase
MKESQIQKKIMDRMRKSGWLVVKLIQTNLNGIPDLLCIRNGVTIFLEVKAENGVVSPLQEHLIGTINKFGVHSRVVNCLEDIDVYCYKNL